MTYFDIPFLFSERRQVQRVAAPSAASFIRLRRLKFFCFDSS